MTKITSFDEVQSVSSLQSSNAHKSAIIQHTNMTTKILVIDDDIAITELMSALLQAHGFDVITTNSGVEGIKLAAEKNLSLVLLDLMMPDLDGRQVSEEIRKFSVVPILILSAVSDPSMIAEVLDAGADGFLTKPVSTNILVAHIKKMTKQTGSLENMVPTISASIARNPQSLPS